MALVFLPGVLAVRAHADASGPLTDRVSLSVGTFLLNTETTMRVDGASRRGTVLDLQRDLGIDDTDRFRFDGYWRITPRQKLRAMYFDTRHRDERRIDRDIQFGDTTFPIQTEIVATFRTRVAELAYEYAVLKSDRYELAATIGLHNLEFDLGLAAPAVSQGATLARSASANGPLPVAGLHGTWRLGGPLYAEASVQFFKIHIDPYDGRLEDYNAALVWQALRHVAIGVGYSDSITRVDVSGSRFDGHLRWKYGGARVFATASF